MEQTGRWSAGAAVIFRMSWPLPSTRACFWPPALRSCGNWGEIFLWGWMRSVASTMNIKDCKVHLCHTRALLHAARLARIRDQKLLRALLTARSCKLVHLNATVQIPAQVAINVSRNRIYLVPRLIFKHTINGQRHFNMAHGFQCRLRFAILLLVLKNIKNKNFIYGRN